MSASDNDTAGTHVPATTGDPAVSAPSTGSGQALATSSGQALATGDVQTPQPQQVDYEIHESATIFPPMRDAEFDALVEDIRVNGQREPIVIYKGRIIDGRHRYRACRKLGIVPVVREWDGQGSLLDFVISANLMRRHLKENQRAMVAARLIPQLEAEAHDRLRTRLAGLPTANLRSGTTAQLVGTTLSVSERSVNHARKVLEHGIPALIAQVDSGNLAVSTAAKVAEFSAKEQTELIAMSRGDLAIMLQSQSDPPAKKKKRVAKRASDPELEKRDAALMRIFYTSTAGLKKTDEGHLCLELSRANWFHELKGFANHQHFPDLLDRGFFIARK